MAKDTDKPRGRVSSYAYFVQKSREEYKKKNPSASINFADFSKKCSEQWKKMGDSDKKKYITLADKDKRRFQDEMKHYVPPKGVLKGRKSVIKKIKDPNAPKRPLSAFFLYCNDERTKVKSTLPSDSTVGDVAKELGKKWKLLNGPSKAKYEQLALKEKARYEKENSAYKAKLGAAVSGGGRKPAKSKKQVESSEDESEQEVDEASDEEEDEDEDDDEY